MRVQIELFAVKAEHLAEVCDVLRVAEVAETGPGIEFRVRLPQPVDVHHAAIVVAELERRLPALFTNTEEVPDGSAP